jgi:DoxX-like family
MSKISRRQVSALALAAFFVVGSLSNIFAPGSIYEEYLRWGYPHWFHFVTGSLELTTAVLLTQARTRLWGSALGGAVMLAALATVIRNFFSPYGERRETDETQARRAGIARHANEPGACRAHNNPGRADSLNRP